jgi:acetyl esterase
VPLDPQVRVLLEQLRAAGGRDLCDMPLGEARMTMALLNSLAGPGPAVASVEDTLAGDIPVRVYRPSEGRLPVTMWFHGGGWTVGAIDQHDAVCRMLALEADTIVVSVEYRLAPEHRYPAALEDCLAATRWAAETFAGPFAVAGDSAGGNLATAVALRARDEGGPPLSFQLLVQPALDAEMSYPSHRENGKDYLLTGTTMAWFWANYLDSHDPRDPLVSPIYARDLSRLPPAFIATAEFDPLRDEGESYGLLLRKAGVDARVKRYDGQVHNFFVMPGAFDAGRRAVSDAAAALKAAFLRT